jgi:hypothetical protein
VPNSANLRPIPFERGNKLGERQGFYSLRDEPLIGSEVDRAATKLLASRGIYHPYQRQYLAACLEIEGAR